MSPSPIENGTLREVHDREEPRRRAEELLHREPRREEVHRHDRPGRVGDHRGEAAERAVGRGGDAVRARRRRPARRIRRRSSVIAITASRITPIVRFTQASSANARNTTPSSDARRRTAGASRSSARQFACRRYAGTANRSATISSSSSVPVDCFAGSTAAKIATATVPAPGTAVFDSPTMSGGDAEQRPREPRQLGHVRRSGRRERRLGERGRGRGIRHPQRRDERADAEPRDRVGAMPRPPRRSATRRAARRPRARRSARRPPRPRSRRRSR